VAHVKNEFTVAADRNDVTLVLKVTTYNEYRKQIVRNVEEDKHMLLTPHRPITLFMEGNWDEARN
jgi:hypothetical protein